MGASGGRLTARIAYLNVVLHGSASEDELVLGVVLEELLEELGLLALDAVTFVDHHVLPVDVAQKRFLEHHLEGGDEDVELVQAAATHPTTTRVGIVEFVLADEVARFLGTVENDAVHESPAFHLTAPLLDRAHWCHHQERSSVCTHNGQ
jgi:sulfur carrier protein ThiS